MKPDYYLRILCPVLKWFIKIIIKIMMDIVKLLVINDTEYYSLGSKIFLYTKGCCWEEVDCI
jgi:hypothetical protein